ncbi:sigma 54-interacting transcriptional regulator [Bacillus tianshenii]|nr:sigma 54-interacting transcriptional regulator [Bacillus tianshenii]
MYKDKDFFQRMRYLDGITIIDTEGTILFTVKFNPRFHSEIEDVDRIIGDHLFNSFPTLHEDNSTLYHVLKKEAPIFKERQTITDFRGKRSLTTNVSLPIISHGNIIGAIELSKDLGAEVENHNIISLNSDMFSNLHRLDGNLKMEQARFTFDDIVTENDTIKELKQMARKVAKGPSPVFIYGETGTGKELFAHAIHNASNRADKPFITQNCSAIPEKLIESILFGTTKGSFTGADNSQGLFEVADGGTIFLDEINSMPIYLQSKLLRVLQDGYVRRVGDNKVRKVNVRIITASNKHPRECLQQEELRKDLFYRLYVAPIHISPLKNRKEDIKPLLELFINKYNQLLKKNVKHVTKEVYDIFLNYDWPGNIREFENVIEFAINMIEEDEDTLEREHIKMRLDAFKSYHNLQTEEEEEMTLKTAVEQLEKEMIQKAILQTKGNVSKAAKALEIPRQTLQNKLKMYNIQ